MSDYQCISTMKGSRRSHLAENAKSQTQKNFLRSKTAPPRPCRKTQRRALCFDPHDLGTQPQRLIQALALLTLHYLG